MIAITQRLTTANPRSRGLPTAQAVAAPINTKKYIPDVTLGRIIPENIKRNSATYFPANKDINNSFYVIEVAIKRADSLRGVIILYN